MLQKIIFVVVFAVIGYYFSIYMEGCTYDPDIRLDGKVVIVTGANAGIGKETTIDLAKKGAKVYMGCRSLERGQKALDEIASMPGIRKDQLVLLKLELSSFESIREFVKEYKKREARLDILINNAGVFSSSNENIDGYEKTFTTNHLGHYLLTVLMADYLVQSAPSRVVTLSSMGHKLTFGLDFDDLMTEKSFYHWMPVYGNSKLANIIFAKELAKRLGGNGVTSVSLHPGFVKTEMGRALPVLSIEIIYDLVNFISAPFTKDAWHGARTSIYCALAPEVENHNGAYFDDCALSTSVHSDVHNDAIAKRLWDVSAELVHLKESETIPALYSKP